MNERLKELRLFLNISQTELAERIGVGRSAISRLENGSNSFTNQMVSSICREFGVSENWLRYGKGEMFAEISKAEKAARFVGYVLGNTDDEFVLNTFIALGQATPTEWEVIKNFVNRIKGE